MSHLPLQTFTLTRPGVRARDGMVAAQHVGAARVGAGILEAGGNAVDAALAASLSLAVLEPWMSGLGGGGFMLVAPADGAPKVLDFGMVAPRALDPAAYPLAAGRDSDLFGWPAVEDDRNVSGPLAIAAPAQAHGLDLAHRTFASMPWADLAAPAIALASAGCPVSWHTTLRIAIAARELDRFSARAVYLPDGLPPVPEAGALRLGALEATLRRLADAGPRDLIDGELARLLVEDLRAQGAVLTMDDLAGADARLGAPLEIARGDARLLAAPGLSAGPTFGHALEVAGAIGQGPPDAATYAAWAEGLLRAYERRLETMGDVDDGRAPACTTHLCVVDREGTMVSLTQTLLSVFGSKVVSPSTGILMNNGVMWFDPRPGRPNSMAPGKRPLSNMCPVIGVRDGRPWFALGASGGRRILPAVMQIASMLTDCGLDLEGAFHTPRINVWGQPTVDVDPRLPDEVIATLRAKHPVLPVEPTIYPGGYACPSAVLRDDDAGFVGMADPMHPHAGAVGVG